jgi:hypothetical protein
MKAEELYGPNGYVYLGNGEFTQCDLPYHHQQGHHREC